MKENAVVRMLLCHDVSGGRTNDDAAASTAGISPPLKLRMRAAEYAASARVAVSEGRSSRASSAAGWLYRRPSRRAVTSVPKRRGGGPAPAPAPPGENPP